MLAQKSPCAGETPVNRSSARSSGVPARSPQQDPVFSAPSTPGMYQGEVTYYSRPLQSHTQAPAEPLDSMADTCQLVNPGPTEEEILNDMYNFYVVRLPQEYMDDRVGFEEHLQMLKEQLQRMEQWEKNQQRPCQVPEQFYLRYNIPEFQNQQFHQVQDYRSPASQHEQLPEASGQNASTEKVKRSGDVSRASLKNQHGRGVPYQVPTSPSGRGVPCVVPTATPETAVNYQVPRTPVWMAVKNQVSTSPQGMAVPYQVPRTPLQMAIENQVSTSPPGTAVPCQVPKTPLRMAVENPVSTSPPGMVFHEVAMTLLEDEQGMANTSSEINFLDSLLEEMGVEW